MMSEPVSLDFPQDDKERLLMLKRAVESVSNGICITNPRLPDNPIIYVNDAFLSMTGFNRQQVLGRNCRFLQRDDRDQSELSAIRLAIEHEKPITVTLRNYRRDGSVFYNELTISPVHDERGRLINFVGVQNDITPRKEAEKRVSEFYSVISHELKTPLTSINGALSMVADGSAGKINSNVARLTQIALESSDRLIRLISDILDLKKIETGKIKLTRALESPESVIRAVIDTAGPLAASKHGIAIECSIESDKALIMDRDRVIQVLLNMVDNAVKFAAENTSVQIRVFLSDADTTRFSVTNVDGTGGIRPEQHEKLFKLFQQLDSTDSRSKGGTGLGLAICKSLVELHGGQIGVESGDASTTFWFDLYSGG